ncbi:cell division protein ZapA [Fusibacter sp. JL216-2]|uniref:cell division protein ZapA n=1 Tax=Fusibacter sp. JL216-2 TaxID=3071453 RepID=UPI003D354317
MTVKNKVIVRILGQEYTIRSDESREFVQKVANLIDDKMRAIYEKNKKFSTSWIAVLTALNVGDDYLKLEQEKEQLLYRLENPEGELKTMKDCLIRLQNELKEKSEAHNSVESEFNKLVENTATYEHSLLELRKEVDRVCSELAQKDQMLQLAENKAESFEKSLKEKDVEIEMLRSKLAEAESERDASRLELSEFIETFDSSN